MPPGLVISSLESSCSDLVVELWLPIQIPSSSESEDCTVYTNFSAVLPLPER